MVSLSSGLRCLLNPKPASSCVLQDSQDVKAQEEAAATKAHHSHKEPKSDSVRVGGCRVQGSGIGNMCWTCFQASCEAASTALSLSIAVSMYIYIYIHIYTHTPVRCVYIYIYIHM